ncbi:hypothetical protein F5Y18DRAFT_319559 [Xylariaceae sp. FL1019]|nr:hypothetical protein F5Y18DRAFT_319559 [Xylariaceae sp. FL1019]
MKLFYFWILLDILGYSWIPLDAPWAAIKNHHSRAVSKPPAHWEQVILKAHHLLKNLPSVLSHHCVGLLESTWETSVSYSLSCAWLAVLQLTNLFFRKQSARVVDYHSHSELATRLPFRFAIRRSPSYASCDTASSALH